MRVALGVLGVLVACGPLAAGVGCSTGGAASPPGAADASTYDATSDAVPDAPTADADLDSPAVDATTEAEAATPEHYEGSIPYDGCAATGTCPPGMPVELAGGQDTPAGMTIDDASVYWIDLGALIPDASTRPGSQVMKCAKAGCGDSPTVLASGAWAGASKLGVDGTNVYWTLTASVLACPLAGCTGDPTVVWSGAGPLYDIAVDSSGVYFTSRGIGQVVYCPGIDCDGGGPISLPSFNDASLVLGNPGAIALDATSVYFVDNTSDDIFACAKADCAGTFHTVALAPSAATLAQIAVDDVNVYATDIEGGRIFYAPKEGVNQTPSVLVRDLGFPVGVASDGANVYFTDTGESVPDAGQGLGSVDRYALDASTLRGTAIAGFVDNPLGLAVDTANVYWTDFGPTTDRSQTDAGRVMSFAKAASP